MAKLTCRFIAGDPSQALHLGEAIYCGKPVERPGEPWCEQHRKICGQPTRHGRPPVPQDPGRAQRRIGCPVRARQALGAQKTADAGVPYIVTLSGDPAKDGGAILLRFGLSDGREIAAEVIVGSVGMLVDRIGLYLAQAVERSRPAASAGED
jgi:hypothetical protein